MGRTLPWLASSVSASTARSPGSARRQKTTFSAGAKTGKLREAKEAEEAELRATSSTSKSLESTTASCQGNDYLGGVSESADSPLKDSLPQQETMREGLDADDIYIMVEDELYDVAKTFTAHLHAAEYQRQQEQAKQRRDRLNGKHTGGALTRILNRRQVTISKRSPTKRGKVQSGQHDRSMLNSVREPGSSAGSDSDGSFDSEHDYGDGTAAEDDSGYAPRRKRKRVIAGADTPLRVLMTGPRKAHQSLIGLHGPRLNSRAAAGFKLAQTQPTSRPVSNSARRSFKLAKSPGDNESTTASEGDMDVDLHHEIPKIKSTAKKSQEPSSARIESHSSGTTKNEITDGSDKPDTDFDGFLKPTPLLQSRRRR